MQARANNIIERNLNKIVSNMNQEYLDRDPLEVDEQLNIFRKKELNQSSTNFIKKNTRRPYSRPKTT